VSSKSDERSDRDYEVGYGRPPKATRFGVRAQPDRSKRQSSDKKPVGWSALLDRSVSVSRNGKQIKMHAYEAMLHGLAKQALQGQIRALRQLMKLFKEAGLLEAPPPPKTHGVLEVPKGVPMELAVRLIRLSGPPPWDADLFDETKAEYEADCAHIEKLNKETEEKYRELGLL
jgi:Family of unknown function (DUF5681)